MQARFDGLGVSSIAHVYRNWELRVCLVRFKSKIRFVAFRHPLFESDEELWEPVCRDTNGTRRSNDTIQA
jgi:hypothetical protein